VPSSGWGGPGREPETRARRKERGPSFRLPSVPRFPPPSRTSIFNVQLWGRCGVIVPGVVVPGDLGNVEWSRDLAVRPPAAGPAGFGCGSVLRLRFGTISARKRDRLTIPQPKPRLTRRLARADTTSRGQTRLVSSVPPAAGSKFPMALAASTHIALAPVPPGCRQWGPAYRTARHLAELSEAPRRPGGTIT